MAKGKVKEPTPLFPTLSSNLSKSKLKQTKKPQSNEVASQNPPKQPFFPLAQYTSLVGVQTTLLLFIALFLPRTPFLLSISDPYVDPTKQTSRDRPQHPFLNALTRNPTVTVASWCLGALVLQMWWGAWLNEWWTGYRLVPEGKEAEKEVESGPKKMGVLRNALLATFVSSLLLLPVLVLFGAPLTSHIPHTHPLPLLLSILTVFPPALTFGPPKPFSNQSQDVVNRMTWTRLFAEFSIRNPLERALVYPTIGTFLGCWIGVIPIALDWDRPWQAWPLTPAFSAIVAYVLASLWALTVNGTHYLAEEGMKMREKTG